MVKDRPADAVKSSNVDDEPSEITAKEEVDILERSMSVAKQLRAGGNIELLPGIFCTFGAGGVTVFGQGAKIRTQKVENGVMIDLDDENVVKVGPSTKKLISIFQKRIKNGEIGLMSVKETREFNKREIETLDKAISQAKLEMRLRPL